MSPVLNVSCRNVDIPLRYLCFFKVLIVAYHYLDSFWLAQKNKPCSEGFVQKHWYPTQIFLFLLVSIVPLFGLILTGSQIWALFWRFRAETLISHWGIYVFVSFDRSIPLFGLIFTGLEKWALFWRFHAETLISHWDIYVFVSFDRSISLFGLSLTGLEKRSPVLKVSCRNVDILLRYFCFCKFRS